MNPQCQQCRNAPGIHDNFVHTVVPGDPAIVLGAPPPDVSHAMRTLTFGYSARCDMPTKAGPQCRASRRRFGRACTSHMTRAEIETARRAEDEARSLVEAWQETCTPACVHWSVTDDARAETAAVMGIEDETARLVAAERLLGDWQKGLCAVCAYPYQPDGTMDHDHESAAIRGFLCRSCNIGEGVGDHAVFRAYRRGHPAAMLGLTVRYCGPWVGWAVPQFDRGSLSPDRHPTYKRADRIRPERPSASME